MDDQTGSDSSEEETSQENNGDNEEEEEIQALVTKGNNATEGDDPSEPKIGMVFNSEDEAFQFFMAYGFRKGFGTVRRSNNTFDGFRYRSTFICSKGGKSRHRPNAKRPPRKKGTKTGCKAKMIVKDHHFQNRWEVIVLELEHNHPLDPGHPKLKKYLLKSSSSLHREKLPAGDNANAPAENLENADLEMDPEDNAGVIRRLNLAKGDLDALIEYFDKMQDQNTYFFYNIDMNEEGLARNVFWADARSRAAYRYFGDFVSFNVTNFADQYEGVLLASFLGTNHHGQPILLGCGLLCSRTVQTYLWLFSTWLRCMNDRPPVAMVTDHSRALEVAVKKAFPDARHRFCLWQILKELPEKLGGLEQADTINFRFNNMVYDSLTIPDFEKEWQEMIRQFGLHSNEWFSSLYKVRKQWVPVYVKDFFWAGMSVTERSESVSNFFDGWLRTETTVKMFLEQYENAIKASMEKEAYEDFRSLQMRPQLISGLPFEDQIAKVYTAEMFLKFQIEVKQLFQMSGALVDRSGSVVSYIVTEIENGRKMGYRVAYDSVEENVWCLCRLVEYRGILCRHALSVLRQELVMLIPSKYINARWRKDFKRLHASMLTSALGPTLELAGYDDLYRHSHQYFMDIVEFGSVSRDSKEQALAVLKEVTDKLVSYEKSLREQRVRIDDMPQPSYTYSLINEDFTDDLSPITLSTRAWDPTQPVSKKKRKKIPGLSVSALDALKTRKKKPSNKASSSNQGGSHPRNSINDAVHVQINEGWSLTPGGAQEAYPYGVETISFDLSQYNSTPNFQWPETSRARF